MPWYYADAGRQLGPVDDDAFGQLVATGVIHGDTLVWRAGMPLWQPYRTIASSAGPVAPGLAGTLPLCSQCGQAFPADELVVFGDTLVCGACKPAYAQRLREGGLARPRMRYAGFWIRAGATLIDSILFYIVGMLIAGLFFAKTLVDPNPLAILKTEGILISIQLIIAALYEVLMVGRYGGTLGKLALRLRVVRSDGSALSYERSFARHCAKFASSIILAIGYIIAAFDEEKQTLHDRICDTRVIYK